MSIKTVLEYPDERLRLVSEPITDINDDIKELIQDLKDTCKAYRANGIAAPQIGVFKRVFVTDTGDGEFVVFINPEFEEKEEPGFKMKEGCLSFPGVLQAVPRFGDITVKALNEEGEEVRFAFEGLEAVAFQHEYDHLDGVLFIDHVGKLTRKMMLKDLRKSPKIKVSKDLTEEKRAKARALRKNKRKSQRRKNA